MTDRNLTATQTTASEASTVRLLLLVRLDFPSGVVAAHSGVGTISYGGEDYKGLGELGGIGTVSERNDLSPHALELSLSGIDPAMVSESFEPVMGRDARLYLGLLDADHQLIDDPVLVWRGRMDTMAVEMGEKATINVSCESRLADWDRPRVRRYNDVDQQRLHPGDRGMEFVSAMVEKEIIWGRV